MNQRAIDWTMASLFALILGAAWQLDKEPAQPAEVTKAQRQAAAEARTERAAAQLCIRTHGPNAAHRWAEDGSLVCTDKKGRLPVTVAAGDQV